ncbi:hypothetical protein SHKM778_82820 [Streptomyces sp. KM77-8]|uniref:Non-canonical purine NTP pyrophosphatase n=1 Tax=Streptomyces haneummycinicus TaxID=3074435 RepID=A0AAT9HWA2_9ACTN
MGPGILGPMTRLILATRNTGKITELRSILTDAGLPHELVGADAYPDIPDVRETGVTFAENALLKAHALARATGLPAVADDSGLCVDVLNGAPGIFSARWSGSHGDDQANLDLLLAQLADIEPPHRAAHFACAAALALPDGTERVVEGRLNGTLRHTPPAREASATTRSSSRRASRGRARSSRPPRRTRSATGARRSAPWSRWYGICWVKERAYLCRGRPPSPVRPVGFEPTDTTA